MGFTPINENAVDHLLDSLPCRDKVWRHAWIVVYKILHRCRRKPSTFEGISLQRGQFIFSEPKLAEQCRLSPQEIRTLLDKFRKVQFLTTKTTGIKSIGTVLNFDTYVIDQKENNGDFNGKTTDYQRAINGKPKGTKANGKSSTPPPSSPLLNVGEEKLLILKFPSKPDAHTLATLKPMPFHYDPEPRIWTAVDSPQARDVFAKMIDLYGPEIAFECTPDQAPALMAQLTAKEPA